MRKIILVSLFFGVSTNAFANSGIFHNFEMKSWSAGFSERNVSANCSSEMKAGVIELAKTKALSSCIAAGFRKNECKIILGEIIVNGSISSRLKYQYGFTGCDPQRDPGLCDIGESMGIFTYGCIAKAVAIGKIPDDKDKDSEHQSDGARQPENLECQFRVYGQPTLWTNQKTGSKAILTDIVDGSRANLLEADGGFSWVELLDYKGKPRGYVQNGYLKKCK